MHFNLFTLIPSNLYVSFCVLLLQVKGQLSKAAQPGLTSVSVEWRQFDEDPSILPQAPQQITALFNGSRQVIYGYVPNCTMVCIYISLFAYSLC